MNKRTICVIRIVAALLGAIGCIGWFAGAVTGLGFEFRFLDLFELPLGYLRGITVDSEGNIYCGLQFYSRIQVYDAEGKFIYGKFIDCAGGAFRIRINENDQLEVATVRNDELYVFEKDGTLVNELSGSGRYYFDIFGETGETRYHDKRQNTTYVKRLSLLGSYIVKENPSGEKRVIITTPFHKWLFMGPFPAWFFVMIAGGVVVFVRKDPFKHLLRRKKEKNNQV